MADVRKELNFCQKTKVPILGVIENMSEYVTTLPKLKFQSTDGIDCTADILEKLKQVCPEVLETVVSANIFPATGGGPKAMAEQYKIPYWGILPMDTDLLECCEKGATFVDEHPSSVAAKSLNHFCKQITSKLTVEEVN